MTAAEIERKQTNRFVVLLEAYRESKGHTDHTVNLMNLCANQNIKNGNFNEAFEYLKREGFLSHQSENQQATITHTGKKIVEFIITHPEERTEQFPPYKDMGI